MTTVNLANDGFRQVRLLTLNEHQNGESTIFRLEKGWLLHFVLGPTIAGKKVSIFTNHPVSANDQFNQNNYRELPWKSYSGTKSDGYDDYAEIQLSISGSFKYQFKVDSILNGSGYFLVDPTLFVGETDERLHLDSISCQTYLSKNLGKFSEWTNRLIVAKECGFNMIHFTPVQSLGASNSAYCLRNQLELNPLFGKCSFEDLGEFINFMKNKWNCLSLVDIVLNHTANESDWLQIHPECAYNVINSPHLKPAYLLDRILWKFGLDVGKGLWMHKNIPIVPKTEIHVLAIENVLKLEILPRYNLVEFYLLNINSILKQYKEYIKEHRGVLENFSEVNIIPDSEYRRLKSTIDFANAASKYNPNNYTGNNFEQKLSNSSSDLQQRLEFLNNEARNIFENHIKAAIVNFLANIRWRFLDPNGEKAIAVHEKSPLMWNYFTLSKGELTIEEEEKSMYTSKGQFCMAHNGWVMGDDPLRNFAEAGSNVYLRRELIPWGDSVKLRYGSNPNDCPFLWKHMTEYAVTMAKTFHGIRLDNCHSTPLHVAEHILYEARKVRPNLYVIAELFTNNEWTDNIFINRLGLTSLIREALNSGNAQDLGGKVHKFGGEPVGAFIQLPARPLKATTAHAILMDQTHDNPSPIEKRSVYDLLASSGLVSMASCAIGSNRGYDELIPHHINVVSESRLYQKYSEKLENGSVNKKDGLFASRKALNSLHYMLGAKGFNEIFVDQRDENVVVVTRHNSTSHESFILVGYTAFSKILSNSNYSKIPILSIAGKINQIVLEARLELKISDEEFKKDDKFINGLKGYQCIIQENLSPKDSSMVRIDSNPEGEVVDFIKFPPGSIIVFRVSLKDEPKSAIIKIRHYLSQFGYRMHTYSGRNLSDMSSTELEKIVTKLTLNDLARVLYRCDGEERDDGLGFGGYNIPNWGVLPYCGLEGISSVLYKIRNNNDLGHGLCENLRQGNWLLDYTINRLLIHNGTKSLGEYLEKLFLNLKKCPRYLIPCYFDALINGIIMLIEEVTWCKMNSFVKNGSSFVKLLSMGSLQFISFVPTALLPALSPNLEAPKPDYVKINDSNIQACPSLCAGLPHFACGIWRNWGRDTFIALRGLCLLTGKYDIARFHILAYAGAVRHGLIPNLLGEGKSARYNARDAIWFWLQSIQEYCKIVPNGEKIFKDKVSRIFPDDNSPPLNHGICDMKLEDVIQECLEKHSKCTKFRERNAGSDIDSNMTEEGFIVDIGIDLDKTGFVYGGNNFNCGTWMDKMGSAPSNRGRPATPRDGSAIELVGLQRSALNWLNEMYKKKSYPYGNLITQSGKQIKFSDCVKMIDANFESYFFIPESNLEVERLSEKINKSLINRRNIYKDTVGSKQNWTDYQLRPNFCVAMVVASDMFNVDNAWKALIQAENILMGPLGIKTLDPSDWNYNGNYINSDETSGFNYHNGPEWLWLVGYFLRAKLIFAKKMITKRPEIVNETISYVRSVLSNHFSSAKKSIWQSLPELTNENGSPCKDSCMAQAWSTGCILEVLYDLDSIIE